MPFNINLDSENPIFTGLFNKIEAEVKPLIPEKTYIKRHYAVHLKLILLNLLKAYRQNRNRSVAYYNKRSHYYPQKIGAQGLKISYEPFRDIVQALETLEYITTKRGFHYAHCSRNARMYRTEKLLIIFRSARSTFPDENSIVLKSADGKHLPYKESAETRKMRDNIEKINDLLNRHFVGLYIPDTQIEKLRKEMKQKGRSNLDLSKKVLHRTFSRGSFQFGGRFYGGFWITLLKEYRPFIRIDHEEVVARDLSATVFSLMYLSKQLEIPKTDPYVFPGADPRDREILKAAAQMLVNNPSRQAALKAINYELICKRFTHRNYTAEEIVFAWELMHENIKDLFYRDLGLVYQRMESSITEAVMLRFVAVGKPILPIHDGFLVKRSDAALLEQSMTEEVIAIYGKPMPFKADGPSKLSFISGEDEKTTFSEYFTLWEEHMNDLQESHLEQTTDQRHKSDDHLPLVA